MFMAYDRLALENPMGGQPDIIFSNLMKREKGRQKRSVNQTQNRKNEQVKYSKIFELSLFFYINKSIQINTNIMFS